MEAHVGLGVPENGRATVRAAAGAFATYQRQLFADLEWFEGEVLSVSSIENLCNRVRRVAAALGDEATFLERRSQRRDAATTEPVPLLGVAIDSDRGLELKPFRFLDDTIDSLTQAALSAYGSNGTTTGPAASLLEDRGDGARREPF